MNQVMLLAASEQYPMHHIKAYKNKHFYFWYNMYHVEHSSLKKNQNNEYRKDLDEERRAAMVRIAESTGRSSTPNDMQYVVRVPEVSEKEKARKLVTNMFIAGFFTL
jgi:vacuolar-type H+-ATPase catalytic subunit A/Vma1